MYSKEHNRISFNVLVFVYFFSMILEKLKWNIGGWSCDLFTLVTAAYFIILVIVHCLHRKTLFIDSIAKSFLSYYFVFGVYVLLQFIIITKDSIITTQYLKGVITTIVQIVAVINIIMLLNLYNGRFVFRDLCYIFLCITIINALYCLIQNINPNVDATLVSVFHSDVSRYGVDPYGSLGRVTGLLLESNFNGPFLAVGFINSIYYYNNYVDSNSFLKRLVLLAFIVLIGIETLFTFSLTTYIDDIQERYERYFSHLIEQYRTNVNSPNDSVIDELRVFGFQFTFCETIRNFGISLKKDDYSQIKKIERRKEYHDAIRSKSQHIRENRFKVYLMLSKLGLTRISLLCTSLYFARRVRKQG